MVMSVCRSVCPPLIQTETTTGWSAMKFDEDNHNAESMKTQLLRHRTRELLVYLYLCVFFGFFFFFTKYCLKISSPLRWWTVGHKVQPHRAVSMAVDCILKTNLTFLYPVPLRKSSVCCLSNIFILWSVYNYYFHSFNFRFGHLPCFNYKLHSKKCRECCL